MLNEDDGRIKTLQSDHVIEGCSLSMPRKKVNFLTFRETPRRQADNMPFRLGWLLPVDANLRMHQRERKLVELVRN